jgi:hypothetical protein
MRRRRRWRRRMMNHFLRSIISIVSLQIDYDHYHLVVDVVYFVDLLVVMASCLVLSFV